MRGKIEQVGTGIRKLVPRTGQSGIERAFLEQPGGPSVLRQEHFMDREDGSLGDPPWIHFASSRRAFR